MSEVLNCWKCGQTLEDLPTPLRRQDECPACNADVHVCRMCEFYDTSVAKSCREPVAEEVSDKERANFCDYFRARPGVSPVGGKSEADAARAQLENMFGVADSTASQAGEDGERSLMDKKRAEADSARQKLDDLFGLDGEDQKKPE